MGKKLAATINYGTRQSQLVEDVRAELAYLRKQLGARDDDVWYITDDSCPSLGPSLRILVENLRAGRNETVDESFQGSSNHSQIHADTAIDGVTPGFSEGAALDDGYYSSKREDVASLG